MAWDALPALQVKSPNIGGTLLAAEQIKSARVKNKLAQAQLGILTQKQQLIKDILDGGDNSGATGTPNPSETPSAVAPSTPSETNALAAPDINTGTVSTPTLDVGATSPAAPVSPSAQPSSDNVLGMKMGLLRKLAVVAPGDAKQILDFANTADSVQRAQAQRSSEEMAKIAYALKSVPEDQRPALYQQYMQSFKDAGVKFANEPPAQYPGDKWLDGVAMHALTVAQTLAQYEPKTAVGKAAWDLQHGIINQDQYERQLLIASKPLMQYNNRQETEESKAYGKKIGEYYGKHFAQVMDGEQAARAQNADLDSLQNLLANVSTGTFAEQRLKLTRAANTVGLDINLIKDLPAAEAAQAITNKFALTLRNPAGGAGMPGSMSDKDREFLQSIPPGIGKSPAGNALLIKLMKKVNDRSIETAKMAREYLKSHDRLDAGFYEQMSNYSDAHPIFAQEDLADAKSAAMEGAIAQDKTGKKIQFHNGKWIDYNGQ